MSLWMIVVRDKLNERGLYSDVLRLFVTLKPHKVDGGNVGGSGGGIGEVLGGNFSPMERHRSCGL